MFFVLPYYIHVFVRCYFFLREYMSEYDRGKLRNTEYLKPGEMPSIKIPSVGLRTKLYKNRLVLLSSSCYSKTPHYESSPWPHPPPPFPTLLDPPMPSAELGYSPPSSTSMCLPPRYGPRLPMLLCFALLNDI